MRLKYVGTETIVDDGYHNAFTDLLSYENYLYLAYRKAQTHDAITKGNIKIIRLPLSEKSLYHSYLWEDYATIDTGGDDRDPKLYIVDSGDKEDEKMLCVIWGTYYPRWAGSGVLRIREDDLMPHGTYFKKNGAMSAIRQPYRPNYWIWSVFANNSKNDNDAQYLAAAYHFGDGVMEMNHSLHLLKSGNGIFFEYHSPLYPENFIPISEPSLFSHKDRLCCIARTEGKTCALFFLNQISYKMNYYFLHTPIHSPKALSIGDETFISGRLYEDRKASTCLWRLIDNNFVGPELELIYTFDTSGDCGYPGMAVVNDKLFVSYYSQHLCKHVKYLPKQADIFLSTFNIEE